LPAKTAAPFEIPYAVEADSPPSIEAATRPAAERLHQLLGEVGPGQVVGGSAGQLLVAGATGAGAYRAMKGDASLDAEGRLQLADGAVTLAKLSSGLGLAESYLSTAVKAKLGDERVPLDGSATSRKLKPTVGRIAQTAGGPMTTYEAVVPGTQFELAVATESYFLAMMTFDFEFPANGTGIHICVGRLKVDGVAQGPAAICEFETVPSGYSKRWTVSQGQCVPLAAGSHTLALTQQDLVVSGGGQPISNITHTGMVYLVVGK
jgi:hypothetical protein